MTRREEQLLLIKIGMLLSESGYSRDIHDHVEIENYIFNKYNVDITEGDEIAYVYNKLLSVIK